MNAPTGRTADETVIAVLGPTNTGKTHYAVERMLARETGVMGFPLRLLAREIYDRVVAIRGAASAALITGEEKIVPPRARYFLCTVEAMPLDLNPDFVAIDEIQLCADPERGHVFTERLLAARGRYETLLLGSDTMRGRIANLVPQARFVGRERFSQLSYTGPRKISRLKPRTAVVAFSTDQVYAIAELIRRQRGGAAVVTGALSPRTRNAQVALYAEGDVDYIVATDAIGMGLNLDIDHVAFAGSSKFDGRRHRALEAQELAQVAGRAGRYTQDGTFGVTGEVSDLAVETVEAITSHRFPPVRKLMWRNPNLQFATVPALIRSLEESPSHYDLMRAREAEDVATLRALWEEPEIRTLATDGRQVRLLWDVCQTPDFPKTGLGEHARLVGRIYRFLSQGEGCIPSDWFSGQVRRLDRVDGEIDTLSRRLAHIRTWTYMANRSNWVADADEWRETTRAVEDRLSDALHGGLTRRFVDRRTSVLMRRLKQKERLVADVSDEGEVTVEGEFVGRLEGFRFRPDDTGGSSEARTLQSASTAALQSEFTHRADKLYLSPDTEIDITEQGGLMWGRDAVGRLEKGDSILNPRVVAFVDDMADPAVSEKVTRRLSHWIARKIKALFEPMLAMRDDEAVTGLARGVAFQLSEAMGVLPRRQIAEDIKALAQEERGLLRKHGVRFGQHSVFLPLMLKPAPTRMRLILWGLWQGLDEIPTAPPPGHVTVAAAPGMPHGYYEKAGYRLCSQRAIRIDMLERLADLLRPLDQKAGFEATPEMLSITGCTLEQLADMFRGLGFEAERGERPRAIRQTEAAAEPAAPPPAEAAEEEKPEAAADESAAVDTAATEAAPATTEDAPPQSAAEPTPEPESAPEPETAAEPTAEAPADTAEAPPLEVFYTFRTRPRPPRGARNEGRTRRTPAGTTAETAPSDAAPGEQQPKPRHQPGRRDGQGDGKRPERKPGGPKGKGGPRPDKGRGAKPRDGEKGPRTPATYSASPRAKEVDPDSPFAILQKLKDRT